MCSTLFLGLQPYLSRLSLFVGCVWFCVRAFATSQTKFQTTPALAAVSLNPARSLAAAQVASTGYSILDTLPLSPFAVRNSVAITPSSARHSSVSLWPRYEGKFQEMSPETLQVVPDRIWRGICDFEFLMQHLITTSYKYRQNEYQQSAHAWYHDMDCSFLSKYPLGIRDLDHTQESSPDLGETQAAAVTTEQRQEWGYIRCMMAIGAWWLMMIEVKTD